MNIQRILVVYKKSTYQIYVQEHKEPAVKQAIKKNDLAAQQLIQSHKVHLSALKQTKKILSDLKIDAVFKCRGEVRSIKDYDLVITLGGDGTVLDVSHLILDHTPLLGINSNPKRSVGYLCAGTVPKLATLIFDIKEKFLRPKRLTRIRVSVDGKSFLDPGLNDILFANKSPADFSRFQFGVVPTQKDLSHLTSKTKLNELGCSGIWVSTAAGSTAVIHSAGGKIMSLSSRQLQYLVREPFFRSDQKKIATHGIIKANQSIVIVNRMRNAAIWMDGSHRSKQIQYGQQIVLDTHPNSLHLIR